MTVKELIEKLQKFDENKEVIIRFALSNEDDIGYVLEPRFIEKIFENEVAIYANYTATKEDCNFIGQKDLKELWEKRVSKMSEDEKQAIDMLEKYITEHKFYNIKQSDGLEDNIKILLDLYQKTKYELEGKECVIDTMSHNEEVLTRSYEILETKLQQEREKNKELVDKTIQYDKTLEKLQKDTIWKDKIKEKIEELENKYQEMGKYSLLRESITYEIKPLKELLEEE